MSQATSSHTVYSRADRVSGDSADGAADTKLSYRYALMAIVLAGVMLRLVVVILAGNGMRTPWGGGGDTPSYVLLAQNLLTGKGYAYAGMPTALRAPAYPILLAAAFKMFVAHALGAVRWVQFFEGIAVALLCAAAAGKLYGEKARNFTLAIALFFPTLVEMNGEILSEATAALFAALFLYFLVTYVKQPGPAALAGMGCAIGLGALVRFNMAALGIVALVAIFAETDGWTRWRSVAIVFFVPVLLVSPWMIRNLIVFHGQVLFSTHSGLDALEGVLTPQGRALPGDSDILRAAVGWVPPIDVETNAPSRPALGPEPELDRQCWRAAIAIAMSKEWDLIPLALKKISNFWLSTDQLFWTGSFPGRDRFMRAAGVLVYWGLLALAVIGWFRLGPHNVRVARILLLYAVLVTAMHLPFVMSTRLRMPLIDPMLAVLAGGVLGGFVTGILAKDRPVFTRNAGA
jgi:hypothetical protein